MANYLVTGGAGFLGSNLVRRLLRDSHAVTVYDSLLTGKKENLEDVSGDMEFIEGDVRDTQLLLEVFASKGFECVFHLAALPFVRQSFEDPQLAHDINATGTLNVLSVARAVGCRRLVFASSCAVYGDAGSLPLSEKAGLNPLSPYAAQKAMGEYYCYLYTHFLGVPSAALRFFNIYGPRQDPASNYAAVVPKFISRLLEGLPPVIFGDGKQTRDFIYVEDAAEACLLAAGSALAPGRIINIGSGKQTSINELASLAATAAGVESKPEFSPMIPGEVRHSRADISTAADILGFKTAIPIQQGLEKTIEFFRNSGSNSPDTG
jgi:nucleoside-diphosphate-sugar epimerase